MIKTRLFKYAVNFLILTFFCLFISGFTYNANKGSVITMVPVLTEIVYSIGAQDRLIGVSSRCNYPIQAREKTIVGNALFINKERIIKLKPEYIFALDSQKPILDDLKKLGIKLVYFQFRNISDIYKAIEIAGYKLDKLETAKKSVKKLQAKTVALKAQKEKRILYIVQTDPLISIGYKSFITDIIIKSGNKSITSDIKSEYPKISTEFVLKSKPDIVVLSMYSNTAPLKKLLPKSRFITLTKEQIDIINRPGPRTYKSVSFFAKL